VAEKTITISINGAGREVREGTTVAELIAELEVPPEQVAVELNRKLVGRARRADTRLAARDVVELVTLVGGG
jgi:thiamine biosynthesis protein ThiS